MAGALAGIRVLEMSGGIAAPFAARLLGDLGAEVIKVEPPDGDPTRHEAPLVEHKSLLFTYLNWNKKSIVLDLSLPENHAHFGDLVKSADIIIESFAPGYLETVGLGYEQLAEWNPRVVLTSISNFGQTGELAGWQATDLILYAMGGLASISGNKYPKTPLKHGLRQSLYGAGLNAAYVSLAAYRLAHATGIGEHVDLSVRDCMASELVAVTGYYVFTGAVFGRHPDRNDPFRGVPMRTKTGYFCMQAGGSSPIAGYSEFFGLPALATEKFKRGDDRLRNAPELRKIMEDRLRDEDAVDLFERASDAKLLTGVVLDARGLLENVHLAERDFWRCFPGQPWRYPAELAKLSRTPVEIRGPEPPLGEHTPEVLQFPSTRDHVNGVVTTADHERLPMKGLRVIDLSAVVAGPYMGAILADMGAEVIKIEGPQKLDQTRGTMYGSFIDNDPGEEPWNRGSTYHILNRGKRSFVCDLSMERGRELLHDLLRTADVLIENFTPRVLRGWGLTPEALESINPRLISMSNSGYGATGRWRNYRAQGTTLELTTGIGTYTGYPGGPPLKAGQSYPDFISCWSGLTALCAALVYRDRTGKGQWIDQGMFQVGAALVPEGLLYFQVTGDELPRLGAEDFASLAGGVFETRDHDRWLAVSIRNDDDLQRLQTIVPCSLKNAKEALASFASTRDAWEAARRLQSAGIPAGPVLDIEDLIFDEYLMDREFYEEVDYGPEVGTRPLIGLPYRFLQSGDRGPHVSFAARDYGADNEYVLRDILHLEDSDIAALYESGVVVREPTKEVSRRPWDVATLREDGPLVRFDPAIRERMMERHRLASERAGRRQASTEVEGLRT